VGQFLAGGGGVLVTLGERVEATPYNEQLYREGEGWLPCRLDEIEGQENQPEAAVRPAPGSTHPSLELFRDMPGGGLTEARFPRWWKVTTPGQNAAGMVAATFRSATSEYPFLVERAYRNGRVLLCTVPLDNTWGTNLPDLPAFVPLAHELVYYLAGARSADFNLHAGQPLRWRVEGEASLPRFSLQPPAGENRPLAEARNDSASYPAALLSQGRGSLLVHEGTRETGVYRLTTPNMQTIYYVVQPDARESDLTPCSEEDLAKVAHIIPVKYENDSGSMMEAWVAASHRQEIWWWVFLGVIGLLCSEIWMTRRMVRNR
jgi:hypothetical protein